MIAIGSSSSASESHAAYLRSVLAHKPPVSQEEQQREAAIQSDLAKTAKWRAEGEALTAKQNHRQFGTAAQAAAAAEMHSERMDSLIATRNSALKSLAPEWLDQVRRDHGDELAERVRKTAEDNYRSAESGIRGLEWAASRNFGLSGSLLNYDDEGLAVRTDEELTYKGEEFEIRHSPKKGVVASIKGSPFTHDFDRTLDVSAEQLLARAVQNARVDRWA